MRRCDWIFGLLYFAVCGTALLYLHFCVCTCCRTHKQQPCPGDTGCYLRNFRSCNGHKSAGVAGSNLSLAFDAGTRAWTEPRRPWYGGGGTGCGSCSRSCAVSRSWHGRQIPGRGSCHWNCGPCEARDKIASHRRNHTTAHSLTPVGPRTIPDITHAFDTKYLTPPAMALVYSAERLVTGPTLPLRRGWPASSNRERQAGSSNRQGAASKGRGRCHGPSGEGRGPRPRFPRPVQNARHHPQSHPQRPPLTTTYLPEPSCHFQDGSQCIPGWRHCRFRPVVMACGLGGGARHHSRRSVPARFGSRGPVGRGAREWLPSLEKARKKSTNFCCVFSTQHVGQRTCWSLQATTETTEM